MSAPEEVTHGRNRRSAAISKSQYLYNVILTCANGYTPGLEALAERLYTTQKFNIVVVAPDRDCETLGSAVTKGQFQYKKTILRPPGIEAYIVQGTPVDCVRFGLDKAQLQKEDVGLSHTWVVSGLSVGRTVGLNGPMCSGGVMAAVEGAVRGLRSISFSMQSKPNHFLDYSACSLMALEVLNIAMEHDIAGGTTLNVNFPCFEGVYSPAGVVVCSPAHACDNIAFQLDPKPTAKGWHTVQAIDVTCHHESDEGEGGYGVLAPEGTDLAELEAENITITPIRGVTVDQQALGQMRSWDWMAVIAASIGMEEEMM